MSTGTEERFWSYVEKTSTCWNWTGSTRGQGGYGRFGHDRARTLAHRYAYELLVGPIPEGLVLDHLCRNHACVNPTHLEPVTPAENVLRGNGAPARNRRKETCKRGHDLAGPNLILRADGGRECKTCRDPHMRVHLLRKAGAAVEWLDDGDAVVAFPLDDDVLAKIRDVVA